MLPPGQLRLVWTPCSSNLVQVREHHWHSPLQLCLLLPPRLLLVTLRLQLHLPEPQHRFGTSRGVGSDQLRRNRKIDSGQQSHNQSLHVKQPCVMSCAMGDQTNRPKSPAQQNSHANAELSTGT